MPRPSGCQRPRRADERQLLSARNRLCRTHPLPFLAYGREELVMPWKACRRMEEKRRFVSRFPDGENIAALCRGSGAPRVTGHTIIDRCRENGLESAAAGEIRGFHPRVQLRAPPSGFGQEMPWRPLPSPIAAYPRSIGYLDREACRVKSMENPFGAKALTMSPG